MRRMVKLALALAMTAMAPAALNAHVGSSTVFYEGAAGPYQVRIVVRPPQVIPGLAEISVRFLGDTAGIGAVRVRPVFWRTGTEGSPRGDLAERIAGPEPLYAAKLWLMTGGSYAVHVEIDGVRGSGMASVPVGAVATAELELGGALKVILIVLGLVLFAGLVTIAYAGAGEALAPAGGAVPVKAVRRARLVAAGAVPVLLLATLGGWRWWQTEAEAYRRSMYRPLPVEAAVHSTPGGEALTLAVIDSAWLAGRITPVIPDHGKMMHMFVMREPALDVFAHLHPAMVDSSTFATRLPPLPAGRYRVYGDIVHESGFERTLVAEVTLGSGAPGGANVAIHPLDPDDSWVIGPEVPPSLSVNGGVVARTSGALSMRWTGDGAPLAVDGELTMSFALENGTGEVLPLEPYMGMLGHAVISRPDGAVFVHLHPMGTVTMAARTSFEVRDRGDTTQGGRLDRNALAAADDPHAAHMSGSSASFPYAFPRAGRHRIWVQLRHSGEIHTAAFDVDVR
jgi:hypothetical protein